METTTDQVRYDNERRDRAYGKRTGDKVHFPYRRFGSDKKYYVACWWAGANNSLLLLDEDGELIEDLAENATILTKVEDISWETQKLNELVDNYQDLEDFIKDNYKGKHVAIVDEYNDVWDAMDEIDAIGYHIPDTAEIAVFDEKIDLVGFLFGADTDKYARSFSNGEDNTLDLVHGLRTNEELRTIQTL